LIRYKIKHGLLGETCSQQSTCGVR